jgi:hypothetical protein
MLLSNLIDIYSTSLHRYEIATLIQIEFKMKDKTLYTKNTKKSPAIHSLVKLHLCGLC